MAKEIKKDRIKDPYKNMHETSLHVSYKGETGNVMGQMLN